MDTTDMPQGAAFRPLSSLEAAVSDWNVEVAKKWKELRDLKGHWIAIYSPQWGHAEDLRRRRETSAEVMQWTVQWFKDRGHEIECQIMADGESIGIREVVKGTPTF
jgi:hypothetical protein